MRSTAVKLLKVKPLPASAIPSLRLPPSASPEKPTSINTTSSAPKAASADVVAELQEKVIARQELGDNVRISNHISNKDLFWKVSKPHRDILKKLLREA